MTTPGKERCGTCNRPMVWITTANGHVLVCPYVACPGEPRRPKPHDWPLQAAHPVPQVQGHSR